jgi:hypothetical protein
MDTCTAERTFARNNIKYPSAKNLFFADGYEPDLFWAAIHSAVRVSTGEADEIAALLIAVFA